jgi:hypothetical protein
VFLVQVRFLLGFAVPVGCILRVPGSVLRTWDDDRSFIVLTETKTSNRYIPVWARYSPLRTRVEAHANTLSLLPHRYTGDSPTPRKNLVEY